MDSRVLGVALVGASAYVMACGGGTPAATEPQTAVTDGGVESFGEVQASDLAELAGLDAGPSAPAQAAPSGAASGEGSPAAGADEKPDECAPVAVEWEKQARPQLRACYAAGKKKAPNLEGTVKITVDIDTLGKVRSTKITEKSLPDPVAQCMLKAVKATPVAAASKCPGKSLTIPMTFPTPR